MRLLQTVYGIVLVCSLAQGTEKSPLKAMKESAKDVLLMAYQRRTNSPSPELPVQSIYTLELTSSTESRPQHSSVALEAETHIPLPQVLANTYCNLPPTVDELFWATVEPSAQTYEHKQFATSNGTSGAYLPSHTESWLQPQSVFTCSLCGLTFSTSVNLANHSREHKAPKCGYFVACDICGKKIKGPHGTGPHYSRAHGIRYKS